VAAAWEDHYTRRARKEGYPARSVYKLQELQSRFSLIRRRARVLDLGAAPGSWTQYAAGSLGASVVAVDLQPLGERASEQATVMQGDILDPDIRARLVGLGPYDVVMSDAAPATSGNRIADTAASEELARGVVELALQALRPGGTVVTKILQ
jgi:23S rRNA (uridine2552-2'-O)-methyltransferase